MENYLKYFLGRLSLIENVSFFHINFLIQFYKLTAWEMAVSV